MTNKDISNTLRLAVALLELHGANPFKVKGLQSALFNAEKATSPLSSLDNDGLLNAGYSKSIAGKILEINETGTYPELSDLIEKTPKGVVDMLNIKGIGAKKVRSLWKDLNITSKNQLMEACKAGSVADLKGFGKKTQEKIETGQIGNQSAYMTG